MRHYWFGVRARLKLECRLRLGDGEFNGIAVRLAARPELRNVDGSDDNEKSSHVMIPSLIESGVAYRPLPLVEAGRHLLGVF